ncbi:hypothetical protein KIN20_015125 [Parelaphostrongylus tenuis]|uniref:Uncharacterized protein n=1 Tax=Parelaphostrongylus tenuis TaxID=148309 RepID=A0AAD5MI36_PARTN|nr:hypothetical protein KIN20_015125 [Parelaphostrongylus tenuis]
MKPKNNPKNTEVDLSVNHVIISVGPPIQLMIGLTLRVDGSVDTRSSLDSRFTSIVRKHSPSCGGLRVKLFHTIELR